MICHVNSHSIVDRGARRPGKGWSAMQGRSLKRAKQNAWRNYRRECRVFFALMAKYGIDEPAELEPWFPRLHEPRLTAFDVD